MQTKRVITLPQLVPVDNGETILGIHHQLAVRKLPDILKPLNPFGCQAIETQRVQTRPDASHCLDLRRREEQIAVFAPEDTGSSRV